MTNKQKNDLGEIVMHRISGIVEFWGENDIPESLKDMPVDEIAKQLSTWLKNIPTNGFTTNSLMP